MDLDLDLKIFASEGLGLGLGLENFRASGLGPALPPSTLTLIFEIEGLVKRLQNERSNGRYLPTRVPQKGKTPPHVGYLLEGAILAF